MPLDLSDATMFPIAEVPHTDLPSYPFPQPETSPTQIPTSLSLRPVATASKLLIVDDNTINRQVSHLATEHMKLLTLRSSS
jgi:hypothetical protein